VTEKALYDPEAPPDRLGGAGGGFSIRSFWYMDALSWTGRLDGARIAFQKMLTDANHVGFYAEEIGLTDEHGSTSSRVHRSAPDHRRCQPSMRPSAAENSRLSEAASSELGSAGDERHR
jgi:hypothetical protein